MLAILFALSALVADVGAPAQPLTLSALPPNCEIARSAIDRFGTTRPVVVVDCGCGGNVITGPKSLEGVVSIRTTAQALEYVRLFSSYQTFNLFEFGSIVEIAGFGDSSRTSDGRYLIAEQFRKRFGAQMHPAVVNDETNGTNQRFRIRRIVVATDGKVYDIEELISGNGVYAVLSRRVVGNNASEIGILHFGDV